MKRMISFLLCLMLVLSFLGCSRPQPEPETEPTEPPTRPVVEVPVETEETPQKYAGVQLQYWSWISEDAPEASVLQQAAEYFEKTTGAKVELHYLSADAEALEQTLAGENGVDLFELPGAALEEHFSAHALELTEYAEAADYPEKSWEVLREQMLGRCGGLKGLALRPHLYGLYYNRDRFDALGIEATPSGWEEYVAFCQMLKDKGYEALTIDLERSNLLLELHMERALGWDDMKETMVYARWLGHDMAKTMVQAAISFAEDGYVVKNTPDAWPKGQNRLLQSNAMLVAGSEVLCSEVEKSTMMEANWGVFPYPGDGPGTGLLVDADVLAIGSACENPEAAFDFAMLLVTGEFDQLRADITKGICADPNNFSPITGANVCMRVATPHAPRYFPESENLLFSRLWNGWYKTGAYFLEQLNRVSRNFADERSVG